MPVRVSASTVSIAIAAMTLLGLGDSARGQVTLIDQFTIPAPTSMDAIAFDPASGNVFVHTEFGPIRQLTTPVSGTAALVSTIAQPGVSANDNDLDFAPESLTIGGQVVPAGTLIYANGEASTNQVFGINPTTGAVLASLNVTSVPGPGIVGSAYSAARDSLFLLDYIGDDVYEVDPATGAVLNSFDVRPAGSPAFDVFYGDVEVLSATGNLYLVSDSQNVIRELTPTGAFVRDIDVNALGVTGMSGIAFDDATGEAYLSQSRGNGTVFHLGGFPVPEPTSLCVFSLAGAALSRRRR